MATRVVLTYADLAALPADGKRYELHEGEIYVTAAPRPRHQQVIGNLFLIITEYVRRLGLGEVFLSPIDVILAEVTVVEPDLIYLEARRLERVSDRGDDIRDLAHDRRPVAPALKRIVTCSV